MTLYPFRFFLYKQHWGVRLINQRLFRYYVQIFIFLDSVRAFLMKNKLGKYNAEEQARIQKEREEAEAAEEAKAKSMKTGERCEVSLYFIYFY